MRMGLGLKLAQFVIAAITSRLLFVGDMQLGTTDALLLEGDMQSGTDHLAYEGAF